MKFLLWTKTNLHYLEKLKDMLMLAVKITGATARIASNKIIGKII